MKTKYYRQYPVRQFEFYAEDGEGRDGTDYFIIIQEEEPGLILVSIQNSGRGRGDVWTDPEESFFMGGFFESVQRLIRRFGGWKQIYWSRIGEKESW